MTKLGSGHQFNALHCDGPSWATNRTQPTANAASLVLDDGAALAGSWSASVTRQESRLQAVVSLKIRDIHQAEAELGADIGTAAAQDALVSVEHRADVTFQATIRLARGLEGGIGFFHLGNANPAVER